MCLCCDRRHRGKKPRRHKQQQEYNARAPQAVMYCYFRKLTMIAPAIFWTADTQNAGPPSVLSGLFGDTFSTSCDMCTAGGIGQYT